MRAVIRLTYLLLGLGLLIALSGCGSTARHENMTLDLNERLLSSQHKAAVKVATIGGKETEGGGQSWIDDAELKQAIIGSINHTGLFSRVVENGEDYLLTVSVFSTNRPIAGFSVTVNLELGWVLQRAENKDVVWREAIKTEHTASMDSGFAFDTRVRLALENATKKNITQGLERISTLHL